MNINIYIGLWSSITYRWPSMAWGSDWLYRLSLSESSPKSWGGRGPSVRFAPSLDICYPYGGVPLMDG